MSVERKSTTVKNRCHTPEQVICKLAEGEKHLGQGKGLDEVTRTIARIEATTNASPRRAGSTAAVTGVTM
jgi:hypothetical protein